MMHKQDRHDATKPKVNILIAEPEPDIQAVYRSFLNGWAADIVATGEKCIDLFCNSDQNFDIVMIDSHIKGPGAIETILKLRQMSPNQQIVVTSTNPNDFEQKMKDAGIPSDGNIELLQKPFSFSKLLSLVHSKVPRVSKVGLRDHVLAIYESADQEFAEAITFLKYSVQNDEASLFVVRKDYDIPGLKERMRALGLDIDSMLADGSLVIIHNEDWYIPDKRVDKHRIIEQWNTLVGRCIMSGKKGLRAFCMMDCFFEHKFAEEVVDYEHTLPERFEMPFVPICAYRKEDIDKLSEDQKKRLVVCHNHVWTSSKSQTRW